MSPTRPTNADLDPGRSLLDPARYAREGYPDALFRRLRDEAPVCRVNDPMLPYWAITRHRDIVLVCRDPERFSNLPHFQINIDAPFGGSDAREPETIIQMDPPKHRRFRELVSARFTPRALQPVEAALDPLADEVIDELEAEGSAGTCDFVEKLATPFPMAVIAWLLEVPRADWPVLFEWTNGVVAPNEPEYQRPGETPHETRLRSSKALYDYFDALARERERGDGDDLVTLLAKARVDGERLPPHILSSYYMLLIVAGNETTRNAISGGLQALIDHPDLWDQLAADPGLAKDAGEECLRWTTPVVQMARTATCDVELHGQQIRRGDTLACFYASANRDERVFADPFSFRFDRRPNPHLAFGIGEHFCVGAHLARIELRAMLRRLTARFERFESAGKPERLQSSTTGGFKRLPVRYAFKPRR
ncbi:MAG: cytochrome P450 [Myxococcota bacterium]